MGVSTSDDAGVFKLSDELALVQTTDVITPVSDDPYASGQVAAANALSDVYAMGGTPLTALNLAFFPSEGVPAGVLEELLRGGHDKVVEAGAVVVGGHTVRDSDVKFGLAVTGTCDPDRFLPNTGCRPGDLLVLTKPVGTGVLINGFRRDLLAERVLTRAVEQMAVLNDDAAREALAHDATAATDVTGFGLAGHARELAAASEVALRIWIDRVPRYDESLEMIDRGVSTALTRDNVASLRGFLRLGDTVGEEERALLHDPQTSGGLLVSLPEERADAYVEALHAAGHRHTAVVGRVLEAEEAYVEVRRSDDDR